MPDWLSVITNLFWILGLAILLAAWSYAYYEAHSSEQSLRELLTISRYSAVITIGLALFCIGLAATDNRLWAQILWIILGIVIVANHVYRRRNPS